MSDERGREVFLRHYPDARPEEWRVEEIDGDGEGGCFVAIFTGTLAEARARRFADRIRSNTD